MDKSDLQLKYQKDINCLMDDDRNIRKTGLTNLNNGFLKPENKPAEIFEVFEKGLLKNLLTVISDKVEKHREITLSFIDKLFEKIKDIPQDIANPILKQLISRLNVQPFPENSEEMRLNIIKLLRKMFKIGYHNCFIFNMTDLCFMISKAVVDPYPEVKRETSSLIMDISKGLGDKIDDNSGIIVKALAQNLNHQHSKVRKITIEAIGEVLLTPQGGKHTNDVLSFLSAIVNDKASDTRKMGYSVIARLLNGLAPSILEDNEPKLVQLLLNGMADDNEDIVALSIGYLDQVGAGIKKLEEERAQKDTE